MQATDLREPPCCKRTTDETPTYSGVLSEVWPYSWIFERRHNVGLKMQILCLLPARLSQFSCCGFKPNDLSKSRAEQIAYVPGIVLSVLLIDPLASIISTHSNGSPRPRPSWYWPSLRSKGRIVEQKTLGNELRPGTSGSLLSFRINPMAFGE